MKSDNKFASADLESLQALCRSVAREQTAVDREAALHQLPEQYRQMFGQMGFYEDKPVLVCNPFDVPPEERARWWDAFVAVRGDRRFCNNGVLILTRLFTVPKRRSSETFTAGRRGISHQ